MAYRLFERFGVELEYMVVDRATLAVRPIVDALLKDAAGLPGATVEGDSDGWPDEVSIGPVTVGNELAAHVAELKVGEPAPALGGLGEQFGAAVVKLNELLARRGAMLLPTGMHPTMDPDAEMKLWPYGNSKVYQAFNRIFDCRGHGWANLQAAHLNLPFAGDVEDPGGEFGRLHAAIRFLLPIFPALTASTPIMDGRVTGVLDNRLEVYRTNSRKIPAAAGKVIPERVFTRADYDRVIFQEIFRQYAPHDPEGLLRHEWANSRGAIARFTRNTIEVRVLDVQECPAADLAILAAITGAIRAIAEGRLGDLAELRGWEVDPLHGILLGAIRDADRAVIRDERYLRALGMRGTAVRASEVWAELIDQTLGTDVWARPALEVVLGQGTLARRILVATGPAPTREKITEVYRELGSCLAENRVFGGG